MSRIPDTHPSEIPILPAAREEPSGLGYRQPENLGDRATMTPFRGTRGSAEVGLNPPSPDFPSSTTRARLKKVEGKGSYTVGGVNLSGSHLENDLHSEKVEPIVWSGDEPSPPYVTAKGPVHFKP